MATANPPRSSNRLPLIIIAIIAVVGLIAGGVFLLTRNQPEKVVQELVAQLPPFVIDRAPARGEEQGTEAPITLVVRQADGSRFGRDRFSDHAQSERRLQVERRQHAGVVCAGGAGFCARRDLQC